MRVTGRLFVVQMILVASFCAAGVSAFASTRVSGGSVRSAGPARDANVSPARTASAPASVRTTEFPRLEPQPLRAAAPAPQRVAYRQQGAVVARNAILSNIGPSAYRAPSSAASPPVPALITHSDADAIEFITMVLSGDPQVVMAFVNMERFRRANPSPVRLLESARGHLYQVTRMRFGVAMGASLSDVAMHTSTEDLVLLWQMMTDGIDQMQRTRDQHQHFEMLAVQMTLAMQMPFASGIQDSERHTEPTAVLTALLAQCADDDGNRANHGAAALCAHSEIVMLAADLRTESRFIVEAEKTCNHGEWSPCRITRCRGDLWLTDDGRCVQR
ncbi:MAG: hypothetical protein FWE64_02345 [Alphaproteobacteria bacterium]|nr:hypothetical protein [Alphaproteobacteria bacterium]